MKTIKKIFWTDVKNLSKNLFALIIAVGVCFLPALYAWFNIYSNWDPYGNTGSLQLAAVSLDEGFTDEDGTYINVGDDIIEEMAGNDKVDWNFVKTQKEAVEGVKSGKYYAAVVIKKDFTYNMYNMFIETETEPTLLFYQNQKKNPVANKISDTVVSTLEENINEEFIKVMTTAVFADANVLHEDIEENGGVDAFIEKLDKLNGELQEYQDLMNQVIAGNAVLSASMDGAANDAKELQKKTQQSAVSLDEAANSVDKSQYTLNTYRNQVNASVDVMIDTLNHMEKLLKEGKLSGDAQAMADACKQTIEDTNKLITDLQNLNSQSAIIGTSTEETINQLMSSVKSLQKILQAMGIQGSVDSVTENIKATEETMIKDIDRAIAGINSTRNAINNDLIPQLNSSMDNLEVLMGNASDIMGRMSGVLSGMDNVFGALQNTISISDTSLEKTQKALGKISEKITKATDKAKAVSEDERLKVLVNTLAGEPDLYGEFFSEPVEINSVAVYPVENYGSAVAPFYTTLSIWVGVIILAAIIKVKPKSGKYPEADATTLFFGRGAFFLVMGQLQTLITVLGDIFLLKIQCIHPFLFWLTSALASLTFTLLIYALVYTFGDVGKAIAVVVLVLQIAGSSGTYPIELLPEFFQKVYIFFPFPYAINAMRESICGLYEADIVIYLLKLLVFILPALVIGLLLRIPFEGINHYMEKRMEDTEMM
ncbi:MAG: YhgE/Pip domain-containing protein [Lachnospiraceae bacterium]|nr:YhgE/Pip domain-containing protein [Lachnospiraceae bacterium]